jgi:hypothetical protein
MYINKKKKKKKIEDKYKGEMDGRRRDKMRCN